jgi:Tfp pilus assembly protein PilV
MLEVLIAGSILIIGMTGIVSLLLRGLSAHREVNTQLRAMTMANTMASQFESVNYWALSAGTVDGGFQTDEDGRKYPVATFVSATGDGGVGAWRVEVHTAWRNGFGAQVDTVATTIVSEIPDAN